MATMIISEKAKAAKAIAEALGSIKTISANGISIYYVPANDIYVIPLRGHIMQYENSPAYKTWSGTDPRNIITDPNAIAKVPNSYAGSYIKTLKDYAKICNRCVIGTDADVEGCNIGLIDAFTFVKQINAKIKVDQLWLSTLQKKEIVDAYNKTIPAKWEWAYAGESRAKIDAIIGFSATREVTNAIRPILSVLGAKFVSIGRVQTCLLYLLYLREDLIRNFKPEIYWSLSANIVSSGTSSDKANVKDVLNVIHVKSPFKDKSIAEQTHLKVKDEKIGQITDIKKTAEKVPVPTPLNTSKALMLLTNTLKITANVALQTLEDLYLNKIISYPRTDSDAYIKTFDHLQYLQQLILPSQYSPYVQYLFQNKRIDPHNGKVDAGDHPPITPLLGLELNDPKFENDIQRKVYDLIARHYLALFGEEAEELKTRITVEINHEPFIGKFTVLVKEGFFKIAPFLMPKYDLNLTLSAGNVNITKILMEQKESQPPPRYSDTTLLKLMEQKNLGTKSTRPAHIETLLNRGYINRVNNSFYVLDLGFKLIETLKTIWLPFLEPNFTEHVEEKLEAIQNGKRKMDDVVDEVKKEFLDLFDKFRANKATIISQMSVLSQTGNVMRGRNNVIVTEQSIKGSRGKQVSTASQASGTHSPAPVKKSISTTTVKKTTSTDEESDSDEVSEVPDALDIQVSVDKQTSTLKEAVEEEKLTYSNCPKCNKSKMKLIITQARKKFLVCKDETCKNYLPLPKVGYPRILKKECRICGFNIIKISGKKNGKKLEYWLCSACWAKSFENHEKIGMCFNCENFQVKDGECIPKSKTQG
jgi:DNA topoisomerase-1